MNFPASFRERIKLPVPPHSGSSPHKGRSVAMKKAAKASELIRWNDVDTGTCCFILRKFRNILIKPTMHKASIAAPLIPVTSHKSSRPPNFRYGFRSGSGPSFDVINLRPSLLESNPSGKPRRTCLNLLAGSMVWLSRALLVRQYGRFMDDLRIYVKGGTGGMGHANLGGVGGKGGDVWLIADEKMTLKKMKEKYPKKRFVAEAGANSSIAALKGNKGKDCEVNVPPGIFVTTDDGKQLGKLDTVGERLLVAHGGIGGCPVTNFLPTKGQVHMIHLDLKLIADVGLIGFPNAGKSSLLTKISHAKPQIADYAFTTLSPEIGTVMYPDHKQITVADLPGLIEGAHANKGRGHKFLKHVERTKQLLFVIDVSGFQLSSHKPFRTAFETIMLLAKELELYKEELQIKSALLAVNKMDLPNAKENFEKLMEQLQKPQNYLHLLPQKMIPEVMVKFREIIPISALTGEGTEQLITCLRKIIDQEAEEKIESYQREQLSALHLSKI